MRLLNMQLVGLACFCFEEEGVGWVWGFFWFLPLGEGEGASHLTQWGEFEFSIAPHFILYLLGTIQLLSIWTIKGVSHENLSMLLIWGGKHI
jgi:hypothetical protein